jgi:hypothetical protein
MPQAVSHWPLARVHKHNTTYKLYAVKDKEIALIKKQKGTRSNALHETYRIFTGRN